MLNILSYIITDIYAFKKGCIFMAHWIEKANIYHIYPFGFCGCEQYRKDSSETPAPRIKKVIDWIPHIKSLNMNAIYFGPIFESVEHGYDTIDYFKIDRRLGTNQDFKEVCKALHENGIRVILDGVFNHVGRDHFAFADLQKNGQSSQYKDWFSGVNFGGRSPEGDNFSYDGWNGYYNLVKLNLHNKNVEDHLLSAAKMWIDGFDIDGIRFDAADCLTDSFIKSICRYTRSIKRDFWLMGEIIHGDSRRWANPEMFDSVTNYPCYKGLYSSHNDRNYFEIAHSIEYQLGQYGQLYLYNFLDNHDVSRLTSILKNPEHANCCYTLMYMMFGVPSVYYGSEFGIAGTKGQGHDADKPVRPNITEHNVIAGNAELMSHISKLGAIRMKYPVVQTGSYSKVALSNQTFLFKREKDGKQIFAALNISDSTHTFNIQVNCNALVDCLSGQIFKVNNGKADVQVPKNKSMILINAVDADKEFVAENIENVAAPAVEAAETVAVPVPAPVPVSAPTPIKGNGCVGVGVPDGRQIVVGGHYKHFKGGDYTVLHVAEDHETCEKQAVYMQLNGTPRIWVRPLNMFLEDVDDHGNIKPRFEYIKD